MKLPAACFQGVALLGFADTGRDHELSECGPECSHEESKAGR